MVDSHTIRFMRLEMALAVMAGIMVGLSYIVRRWTQESDLVIGMPVASLLMLIGYQLALYIPARFINWSIFTSLDRCCRAAIMSLFIYYATTLDGPLGNIIAVAAMWSTFRYVAHVPQPDTLARLLGLLLAYHIVTAMQSAVLRTVLSGVIHTAFRTRVDTVSFRKQALLALTHPLTLKQRLRRLRRLRAGGSLDRRRASAEGDALAGVMKVPAAVVRPRAPTISRTIAPAAAPTAAGAAGAGSGVGGGGKDSVTPAGRPGTTPAAAAAGTGAVPPLPLPLPPPPTRAERQVSAGSSENRFTAGRLAKVLAGIAGVDDSYMKDVDGGGGGGKGDESPRSAHFRENLVALEHSEFKLFDEDGDLVTITSPDQLRRAARHTFRHLQALDLNKHAPPVVGDAAPRNWEHLEEEMQTALESRRAFVAARESASAIVTPVGGDTVPPTPGTGWFTPAIAPTPGGGWGVPPHLPPPLPPMSEVDESVSSRSSLTIPSVPDDAASAVVVDVDDDGGDDDDVASGAPRPQSDPPRPTRSRPRMRAVPPAAGEAAVAPVAVPAAVAAPASAAVPNGTAVPDVTSPPAVVVLPPLPAVVPDVTTTAATTSTTAITGTGAAAAFVGLAAASASGSPAGGSGGSDGSGGGGGSGTPAEVGEVAHVPPPPLQTATEADATSSMGRHSIPQAFLRFASRKAAFGVVRGSTPSQVPPSIRRASTATLPTGASFVGARNLPDARNTSETISIEHLRAQVGDAAAQTLWEVADIGSTGEVTQYEMYRVFQLIYDDWLGIRSSLAGQSAVSSAIRLLSNTVFYFLMGIIAVILFQIDIMQVVLALATIIVPLAFAFQGAATTVVDSITFVVGQRTLVL